MITSHVKEMADAISANVEYLKKNQIAALYLKDGQFTTSLSGIFVYRFDCDFISKVDLDYRFDVLIGKENYPGQLIASTSRSLDIGLPENLGSSIARAEIAIGNYHLLEKLKESLLENRSHSPLGDELIGTKTPHKSSALGLAGLDRIGSHLNQYQRQALGFIDRNSISYIWGPPGTGKTQTIASIIESLIDNDLNVLLLSHTNIATDEALLKVSRQLSDRNNANLEDGRIIRVGKIQHNQLLEEFGSQVKVEDIADRRTLAIDKRIEGCREAIASADGEIQKLDSIRNLFVEQSQILDQSQTLQGVITERRSWLKDASQQLVDLKSQVEMNRQQIAQTENQTGWSRLAGVRRLRKLQQSMDELEGKIQSLEQESSRLRQELDASQKSEEQIQTRLGVLVKQTEGWDLDQAENKLKELRAGIKYQKQLIVAAEKEKARTSDSIINDAQLIATTLTNSHLNKKIISRDYDCVIVDEASMAPLPAVWYAAGLAQKRVVIVGDFCQLPPIINYKSNGNKEDDGLVKKWLETNIFQVSGIEDSISGQGASLPQNLVVLREQHRMPKEIADLVNHIMYGRFRNGQFALISSGQQETQNHKLLSGQKLGVIDTSAYQPVSGRSGTGSPYCIFNALLITALIDHAIKRGYKSIGALTAYRAQANLIQTMIKDRGLDKNEEVKIEANTIHKFQGGERDLIILDITVDYGGSMYERENADKLINVALSRTRQECLIIGNCQAIAKKHQPASPTRKMLDYIRASGRQFLDASKVVKQLIGPSSDSNQTAAAPIRMVNDREFYSQFLNDTNGAQKEIIIVSPFLKLDRCRSMIEDFKPALSSGLPIFIITRRPAYGGFKTNTEHQQAMELLDKSGLVVLPIEEKLHEKLALIDRKIIWFGSLNIMSHTNSSDLMWRMTQAPEMIKQLINSYRLDKNVSQVGINPLEKCQKCSRPGALFWNGIGKYGPYTYCLLCWHKKASSN